MARALGNVAAEHVREALKKALAARAKSQTLRGLSVLSLDREHIARAGRDIDEELKDAIIELQAVLLLKD